MIDILITNALIATARGEKALGGAKQGDIAITRGCIGIANGKICHISEQILEARRVLDAGGRLVTPGLVDPHTHLVFGGSRQNEVPQKLAGASYMEILAAGGGILSTVRATRAATHADLYVQAAGYLDKMAVHGTTACEIKSGYGLDFASELKQLEVIRDLQKNAKPEIVATFMGAHAIPPEFAGNAEGFVDALVEMIPKIANTDLAKYCDIFTETGIFDIEQSRRIMMAARDAGFCLKIHADEITPLGGAELAAEMGAVSAEHLIEATDAGISAMARAGTIAVLLPATSFYLDKPFARARDMIARGVPVALATDFNPGSSPNFNMQFVLNLAYLKMRLNPAQALTAATLNAAAAIGLAENKGSIEIGKDADLVIWDCPDLDYLFYRYGDNQVFKTIILGEII